MFLVLRRRSVHAHEIDREEGDFQKDEGERDLEGDVRTLHVSFELSETEQPPLSLDLNQMSSGDYLKVAVDEGDDATDDNPDYSLSDVDPPHLVY